MSEILQPERRLSMHILESAVGEILSGDGAPAYLRCGTGQYRMLMTLYAGDEARFPRKQFRLSFGLEVCALWGARVSRGTIVIEGPDHEILRVIDNLQEP